MVLPTGLVDLFRSAKWLSDWSAPIHPQIALARLIESGDFERHLRRARTLYRESRVALLESIDLWLAPFSPRYYDSQAGLHVLLSLPGFSEAESRSIMKRAEQEGVRLYPSKPCYLDIDEGGFDALSDLGAEWVMGFARLSTTEISEGIKRLSQILVEHVSRRSGGVEN